MINEPTTRMAYLIMRIPIFIFAIFFLGVSHSAEFDCGVLKNWNDYGPFDYADPASSAPTSDNPMGVIKRVENVHFQAEMKALNLKRFSIENLSGEFVYTLRMFPNHPEALYALSRLEVLSNGKLPQNAISPFTPKISADCFFDRALRFKPDDKAVHLVHALHLHQRKKHKEALVAYELAESLGEDSVTLNYNLGLLHTDMKNWEKAILYAQKAYAGGVYLSGLRTRIEKAGFTLVLPSKTKDGGSVANQKKSD